jgi:hypothetical protein
MTMRVFERRNQSESYHAPHGSSVRERTATSPHFPTHRQNVPGPVRVLASEVYDRQVNKIDTDVVWARGEMTGDSGESSGMSVGTVHIVPSVSGDTEATAR